MSTAPQMHAEEHDQADGFGALEERVMRMVELVRTERRERQRAEETAAALQQLLDEQGAQLGQTQDELKALSQERDLVRGRVERLLKQLDDLG
ncbi:hypothetical protein [Acidipila sp. EB88]|uniref:hypothetical protein n=1 Tax=Acidipila sp. EB88 TaxID=2305226 RepID=UPI001F32F09F|nr:hypothetical protein [Acidipila sp. EB88]